MCLLWAGIRQHRASALGFLPLIRNAGWHLSFIEFGKADETIVFYVFQVVIVF